MKRLTALMLVWGLLLCACAQSRTPSADASVEMERSIQIGVSFDSFVIERWQRDRDVFVSTANELGAEVLVQDAGGDSAEQVEQIRYFINKGVDAIVIVAVDCYGLSGVVQEAKNAGIVIVAYDRLVLDADIDFYISFDSRMVGQMMAEAMLQAVPEGGSVLCIFGSPSDNNVTEMVEGFHAVFDNSGRKIIRAAYADGWLAETAYEVTEEVLESGERIDGVVCGNDDLASMAFQALSEYRIAGQVSLVGQDADLFACQRIVEGTQTMTVYKPVEQLAKQAAEYTVLLAKGETPDVSESTDNGFAEVPCCRLKPVEVTADNMNEVIVEGGFHLASDIYLNVQDDSAGAGSDGSSSE